MARTGAAAAEPFACEIGLVQIHYEGDKTVSGDYIPLQLKNGNVFETIAPVKMGTRFKMEVRNRSECYVYVFGKETDGTSYTLFPYPRPDNPEKTKYSPFCGITGYRLFPKDKSMMPDSIGTRDVMAVVVSKQPLDWYGLNNSIGGNPGQDYATRVDAALGNKLLRHVVFKSSAKGNMQFTIPDANPNSVIATIVEISKK